MTKRTLAYSAALAAVLFGGLGPPLADRMRDFGGMGMMMGGMSGPMPDFEAVDTDNDGKITTDEMKAYRTARIEALDADKDGKVSRDELVAMKMQGIEEKVRKGVDRMMERVDADGDGALVAAEMMVMPAPGGRMLERLDTDGDGAISKAEAEAMRDHMRKGPGKDKKPGGRHHGTGHGDKGMKKQPPKPDQGADGGN